MINHGPRVRRQTTHGTAEVGINFEDLLNRAGFQERRRDALLHAKDDTLGRLDTNGGGTELWAGMDHGMREYTFFQGGWTMRDGWHP